MAGDSAIRGNATLAAACCGSGALAREHLELLRWPTGPECPTCGNAGEERITRLNPGARGAGGRVHRAGLMHCRACGREFNVTVGTALEGRKLGFEQWIRAVQLMCGDPWTTAKALQREFSWAYATAWRTACLIRTAMKQEYSASTGEAQPTGEGVDQRRDRVLRRLLLSPPDFKVEPLRGPPSDTLSAPGR